MTTDAPAGPEPAHSAFRVLAALADLGEATAAAIAQHAGLGYSTVTPKLRAWETSGHAEKYRHAATNQTLWRLTSAGRAATGAEGTALHADTEPSKSVDGADRPAGSSPAEPAPSDVPPAEPDAIPSQTGVACQRDDEQPAPCVVAAQLVPTPPDAAVDADPQPAEPAEDDSGDAAVPDGSGAVATPPPVAKRKRPAGALEASALAILRSRPDEEFKVNDLRKLVDEADEGTGFPAASAGAISNALTKLTGKGEVDTVEAKHATFQAAPVND
jgi:hypothetical protein